MGRILRLELKRVLKSGRSWALLAAALLLTLLMAGLPVMYCYSSVNEQGQPASLTGLASIACEKTRQAAAAGTASPERVKAAAALYRACLERYGVSQSYDLPEGVYEREILPIAPLLHGVKEAFADPDTGIAPSLMEIAPEKIDGFYAACEARLASLMEMEGNGDAAKAQALSMYGRVEKPFEVYPGFSTAAMDFQNMAGFLVLLICACIAAPVFSAGYQSGDDDILRCTRYGRGQLGAARVIAVLLVSGCTAALCGAAYLLLSNSIFGWGGTKTSIQMAYSVVTLADWNLGQLQWAFVLAGVLSVLATASLALLVSACCRSAAVSLGAALAFCLAPTVAFMALPEPLSLWLCSLLPSSGVCIQTSFLYAVTDFNFLQLGPLAVWTPYAMAGVCLVEIPLFSALAVRSYCRHKAK